MKDLEQLNKVLVDMVKNINSYDKERAKEKLGVSLFSINKYLRGDGENAGTTEKLIVFFKKCIKKREALLEEVLND